VNQSAWSYSLCPIMEPFRDLVKHNETFHWDTNLDYLFSNFKEILLDKITDGIQAFDSMTCLQPDWSKTGLGYLLLQKHCTCSLDNAPICCPDGWKLVFAGSRFTQGAESPQQEVKHLHYHGVSTMQKATSLVALIFLSSPTINTCSGFSTTEN